MTCMATSDNLSNEGKSRFEMPENGVMMVLVKACVLMSSKYISSDMSLRAGFYATSQY